ncbi:MAG: SDR family NAD-dependent epimerase/dehydratase, partial [Solirubrobacterales bacterium]
GADSEVLHEPLPTDDPQVRQPDITRAREVLGWEPETGLTDGLKKTIELSAAGWLTGESA